MTKTAMSQIEQEMQAAREAYEKKMAKLEADAAKEEARISAAVLELLQENEPELYDSLREQAVEQLEEKRTKRRRTAKAARAVGGASAGDAHDDDTDEPEQEHEDSYSAPFAQSA